MGVFISWSGKNTKSYLVAMALRGWLQQVVQGCNPWVSAQDIDAGERWGTELFTQLDKHSVGIICVTKENQAEPWLNFEAGALVKQLKGDKADESRVCPLLIEMTTSDVTGPLKLLQMMLLDKDGMFQVSQMVNKYTIQTPLTEEVLKKVFEKFWPDLHTELQQMKAPEQPGKSSRSAPEMLEEILSLVRSIDKAANWSLLPASPFGPAKRSKIVNCRAGKMSFGWGDNPAQFLIFETEDGFHFTCRAEDIPSEVRRVVETGGTVKAEVGTERDFRGDVAFIRFVV